MATLLPEHAARIEATLDTDALVLDVGAGMSPFPRADWVIDLIAHEERGQYGPALDPSRERFDSSRWVRRDICDREPWPFSDNQFDFVICSHTLEDVRDPVWVCDELTRVGKAGYIEVPSRLEEQSYAVHGDWVGWSHHRWLVDIHGDEITFVFKSHVLHNRESDHFPRGFHETLAPEERVRWLWWDGGFRYRERVLMKAEEVDSYLADFVAENQHRRREPAGQREPRPRRSAWHRRWTSRD